MSNQYPPGPYSQPGPYQSGGYSQPVPNYQAPPVYVQPVYQQPVMMVAQPQLNNKALTSMILGIISWVLLLNMLTGIPALILGHLALGQIKRSNGAQTGKGLAITGLVLGYLSIAGAVLFFLYFLFFIVPTLP